MSAAAAQQPHRTTASAVTPPPPATPVLTLAEVAGKGRTFVASQPLRAGQIILRDSPILLYSAFPLTATAADSSSSGFSTVANGEKNYCSHCFRSLQLCPSSLVPCFSCSDAVFCNPSCRAASLSSSHTPWLCQTLVRLRNCPSVQALDADRQVQARFLVAAYNLAAVSPSQFHALLSLHGGGGDGKVDDDDNNNTAAATASFLHSLIASLSLLPQPPPGVPDFGPGLAEALLVKDKLNAFSLMEPFSPDRERSARAYGIYPNASFFNHDCLPNACRFDSVDASIDMNTDIIIRAIYEIPQGREISLSYFRVNVRYPERQKRLREDYGFTCQCDRCKIEANWSDSDDNDDDDDAMEEDRDEPMEAASGADEGPETAAEGDDGFPHAFFFVKFMCNRNNCWGTMAPLPPSDDTPSNIMECCFCGKLKNDDDDDDDEIDGDS